MPKEPEDTTFYSPSRGSREQFDRQASHYDGDWNRWSGGSLRWLIEHAGVEPGDSVLDVATGTGFTARAFAPLVHSIVGMDVSTGMLMRASQYPDTPGHLHYCGGAAEQLPFANASFDVVTCRVAPHHFLLLSQFAREGFRVLRTGGRLLIADTSIPDDAPELDRWQNHVESLRDPSHVRNYPSLEWRAVLESAGFQMHAIEWCEESASITLNSWLTKSGCEGAAAAEVRRQFQQASPAAREAFRIEPLPDGDVSFQWKRIAIAAVKP